MAVQIIGTSNIAEVNADKAQLIEVRAPAFGALGAYQLTAVSGALAATLGAGSTLFSLRWTDATRLCLLRYLRATAIVSGTITAGVLFDLEAVVARGFTVSDTGGTALAPLSVNNKLRTSMGSSLVADLRIATTAGLGAGTRTPDASALGRVQGSTGTAVGTQLFGISGPPALVDRTPAGMHPIVLAANEGILIRSPLAGPATGTLVLCITAEWAETVAY